VRRKKETVYYDAAENLINQRRDFACHAIGTVYLNSDYDLDRNTALAEFSWYFKPFETLEGSSWFGEITSKNQLARSLALLLMHEVIND